MALHYSNQVYFRGEEWSRSFSMMQLGGFVMATLGTLLYGRGDAAERQLEREVGDLEHSIRKLHVEMQRQTSDIARLDQTRAQLEADLRDKSDALALDQECEALQNELTDRMK